MLYLNHQIVSQIKTEHPTVGEMMLMGHLHSKNIVVQRWRLRESLGGVVFYPEELQLLGEYMPCLIQISYDI